MSAGVRTRPTSVATSVATSFVATSVAAITAAILVVLAVVVPSTVVSGDQTVRFDDAGDAPHISLIGDSTLTGVRWYADYGPLRSYNFVLSAESCRRTIEQSCISREGYRSQNVLAAMATLDGELGEVLVVMSGYNDPQWTIDEAIAGVVDEARRQGVGHVVWLTLRTSSDVDYSDPQEQSSINTFRAYNEQLHAAAAASGDFFQVADWATYSNGASSWFEADGVHLTPQGVDALTAFLATTVDRVLAGEDVSPAEAPWTVLVPGATGDSVETVQDALLAAGIDVPGGSDGVYGNDTMAAVAEYQRRAGDLQVTGAVDLATAQHLGVVGDEDPAVEPSTSEPATRPAAAPPAAAEDATTARSTSDTLDAAATGGTEWPFVTDADARRSVAMSAAAIVAALVVAVVVRRRIVVARRRARRWARVHPATSPHRSVADLRRDGHLPARGLDPAPTERGGNDDATAGASAEHVTR